MLSVTPIRTTTYSHSALSSFKAGVSQQAISANERGNDYLKHNEIDKAIASYKEALRISDKYAEAYFNLGKAYNLKKDYESSVGALQKASELKSKDVEIVTTLGEAYKNNGQYNQAISAFNKALQINPNYDYAKRNLAETQNIKYSVFNPKQAYEQRKNQAQKNLSEAVRIAKDYLPQGYMNGMSDVCITFDKTDSMSGRSNIAQYEHSKRKITVTDDYVWANPVLISAYLVHEFVHAKDNDAYTSVAEEQDAYEAAAKFWKEKGATAVPPVEDPEMDYVLELYNDSPKKLKDRVAMIYKLRDPSIATTSPNHPPRTVAASSSLSDVSGASGLKAYDVIA